MRNLCRYCTGIVALLLTLLAADAAESDVQAIERTYTACLNATNEKDIVKWSSFLADAPYF